jgi:hypothetical protein
VNPKPTVQSGWEKMEVLQAFKKWSYSERLLKLAYFSLKFILGGFLMALLALLNLSSLGEIA